MRAQRWSFSVLLLMALAAVIVRPQEKGGQEEFGPYEPVPNWPQPCQPRVALATSASQASAEKTPPPASQR